MEKSVYFIRHGESEENVTHVHIGKHAALTEIGREQAKLVAERIERIGVDAVISSPFTRALDTATAIAEKSGISLETNELFGEWLEPSHVNGLHRDDAVRSAVITAIQTNLDHEYRHTDEENFAELLARAEAALAALAEHKSDRLCVVTHGGFLRVMVGLILFREAFTKKDFMQLMYNLKTVNTGVTYARYTDDEKGWQLLTWNDQSHLG